MVTETEARSDLYRRHAIELTRFATSLVGPNHAHDVVSEAVMQAMWSDRWGEVLNPRAYLYQAVLNAARMHHRSTSRRRRRESMAARPDTSPGPDAAVDVWDALGHLSIRQRAVIFLTYWEDLSEGDIAYRLDVSERSVRRYLAKARDQLREALHD